MARVRPKIGVLPGYDYEKNKIYLKRGYYQGIIQAGGLPLILPQTEDIDLLEEAFLLCDGLLLSGGPDADARLFGEQNLNSVGNISPVRDFTELWMAKEAISRGKPVFGICRGVQVMNIAMGGTLYQDIHSQIRDRELLKHDQQAPEWYPVHDISIKNGSRVWRSFGKGQAAVNSFHHQAVRDPAPGFEITATSPDGIIEAIEYDNHRFAVGVQWHPELMWEKDAGFLSLFGELVSQAGKCN